MSTMKTVAAFENQDDVERAIDELVDAGIDPSAIEVAAPAESPLAVDASVGAADDAPAADGGILLAVTAPDEDTALVEDILKETGEIDLGASDTPALGWAGDPTGESLDTRRTPDLGWAGKPDRSK